MIFYLGELSVTIRQRTLKVIQESQAVDYTKMEHPQSDKENKAAKKIAVKKVK